MGMMNPIHHALDQLGMPWRSTRAELANRFGVQQCYWSLDDVVELAISPKPFPGMVAPVSFRTDGDCSIHVPPLRFHAYADPHNDALRNLDAVRAVIEPLLGPGQYQDQSVNARGWEWECGPASITLYAFPPKLQDHDTSNSYHEREPRLTIACSISIDTGYRPPLSEEEQGWIDGFVPAIRISDSGLPRTWTRRPRQTEPSWLARFFGTRAQPSAPPLPAPVMDNDVQTILANLRVDETALEYTREPPPGVAAVHGWLGQSPGGEAIIYCDMALRIIPRSHIVGIRLSRYEPERGNGPGDAIIDFICHTPEAEREVTLVRSAGIASLDELANEVAAWLTLPLETIGD